MKFKPNLKFKRDYDWIYRQNPEAANTLLLLAELADSDGQVVKNNQELADLFSARFSDPKEYSL